MSEIPRPNERELESSEKLRLRAGQIELHYHALEMKAKKPSGCLYAFLGVGAGGCLLPILLLAITAALGDTGGPLFWPLISIPLALIGLGVGLFVHSIKSKDTDV